MWNSQFLSLTQEEFNFLLKNGKRSSKLLNFDFESLIYSNWATVKETLPDLFAKNEYDKLILLLFKERGINHFICDIHNISIADGMSFILWIIDEVKAIQDLEIDNLRSNPSIKQLQAGINELDKFGIDNTRDNLTDGKLWHYDKINNMPYYKVFDKQLMEITKNKINEKMAKIKN